MRKKNLFIPFMLTFTLLTGCNKEPVNPEPVEPEEPPISTNFNGEIEAPMISKILSKIEVNLTTLLSWDIESTIVMDDTLIKNYGDKTTMTMKHHGFYTSPIAQVNRTIDTVRETHHGNFTSSKEYVDYYFKFENLHGKVTLGKNEGVYNTIERSIFTPHYKGEKMQAYIFSTELTNMRNYTEAYYDETGLSSAFN